MEVQPLPIRELWGLAKESVSAWSSDYAPSMGAAIAFYTIFSIAPMLIIVIAVAGLVFGEEAARAELMSQIPSMAGEEAAVAVGAFCARRAGRAEASSPSCLRHRRHGGRRNHRLHRTAERAQSHLAGARSARAAVSGACIWSRIIALVLVLGIAGLLLGLVAVSTVITALGDVWSAYLGGWDIVLRMSISSSASPSSHAVRLDLPLRPRADIAWSDVWLGAAVTAVLFIIGRYLIGLYLGTAGIGSGFGAAGSLVVLLMWVYYTAQIFLLGAEFTWVYAHRHGSRAARSGAAERRPPRPWNPWRRRA
jgi:membrane protein